MSSQYNQTKYLKMPFMSFSPHPQSLSLSSFFSPLPVTLNALWGPLSKICCLIWRNEKLSSNKKYGLMNTDLACAAPSQ